MAAAAESQLDDKELHALAGRAKDMAVQADDPNVRTALQLLAEAAENAAIKLAAHRRT